MNLLREDKSVFPLFNFLACESKDSFFFLFFFPFFFPSIRHSLASPFVKCVNSNVILMLFSRLELKRSFNCTRANSHDGTSKKNRFSK